MNAPPNDAYIHSSAVPGGQLVVSSVHPRESQNGVPGLASIGVLSLRNWVVSNPSVIKAQSKTQVVIGMKQSTKHVNLPKI